MTRTESSPSVDEAGRKQQVSASEKFQQQLAELNDAPATEQTHCDEKRKRKTQMDSEDQAQTKHQKLSEGKNDVVSSPYFSKDLDLTFSCVQSSSLKWRKIKKTNLDLDYTVLFPRNTADTLVQVLENEVDYFTGTLAKIKVFGKWHDIPRKQVAIILLMFMSFV